MPTTLFRALFVLLLDLFKIGSLMHFNYLHNCSYFIDSFVLVLKSRKESFKKKGALVDKY